jgi:hypothetical protein
MEVTRIYDEDCDVFNLHGVVIAALRECLDIELHDTIEVSNYICETLYEYACGLCKENQIPAIVFVHGKLGEFHPIELDEETEEVM